MKPKRKDYNKARTMKVWHCHLIDDTIVGETEPIEFPVGASSSPAVAPSATVKDEVPETDDLTAKSTAKSMPSKITIPTPDSLSVRVVPKAPVPEKSRELQTVLQADFLVLCPETLKTFKKVKKKKTRKQTC